MKFNSTEELQAFNLISDLVFNQKNLPDNVYVVTEIFEQRYKDILKPLDVVFERKLTFYIEPTHPYYKNYASNKNYKESVYNERLHRFTKVEKINLRVVVINDLRRFLKEVNKGLFPTSIKLTDKGDYFILGAS
jgi:hypothetical protein